MNHPGSPCCENPELLAWWVRFQEAWCRERFEVANDMYQRGQESRVADGINGDAQHLCFIANSISQEALIVQGHAERVAAAHRVPWPKPESS